MKITRGEITITDVPGVDYIKVDTASNSVAIKFSYFEHPVGYDFANLVELRDALATARGLLTEANNAAVAAFAGEKSTLSAVAEVGDIFNAGDDEPPNVLAVSDREGDDWRKTAKGYRYENFSDPYAWTRLVDAYAPLTVTAVDES